MAYVLSKIAWLLAQPSSVMWLTLVIGVALASSERFLRSGRRIAWAGLVLLTLGFSPLANLLVLPLEQRFPVPAIAPGSRDYAGIIVLGGAEDGPVSVARGQLSLNEAGDRITEGARLAHLLPSAKLVFTGGTARLLGSGDPGGDIVATFWREMGIAADRIAVEQVSLTTHENAVLTHAMLKPKPGERYLLVTSAMHQPRAMGVFRKAGFDVTAYPCDFRTAGAQDRWRAFDALAKGFRRLDDGVKEWAGLVAYRLAGRSDDLWPSP